MPYTACNRRNRSLKTLPGWGRQVLLLAIIPLPLKWVNNTHRRHVKYKGRCRDMWSTKALKYFYTNHGDKRFFQFEFTMNVLVSSFCFIRISTLHYCGVYGHYKYFTLPVQLRTSKSDVYRRQILTSKVGQR